MTVDALVRLLAVAGSLEREGQYNCAKLLRAAVDALLTQPAFQLNLAQDRSTLLAETKGTLATLAELDVAPALLAALERAYTALTAERLPSYAETPDPYVCRICGNLMLENEHACPFCNSQPESFKRFRPIYWIEVFDPFDVLNYLQSTPRKLALLVEDVTEDQANQAVETGGWTLRQAVSHLNDAQGVLAYRVELILTKDTPVLEAKAVFDWADDETKVPATLQEILTAYFNSRAQTVERLANLPLKDWWRCGRHEEFGELKLYQQVSYFASHELAHFPQIERLAKEVK